jgi:hypothetical protein
MEVRVAGGMGARLSLSASSGNRRFCKIKVKRYYLLGKSISVYVYIICTASWRNHIITILD